LALSVSQNYILTMLKPIAFAYLLLITLSCAAQSNITIGEPRCRFWAEPGMARGACQAKLENDISNSPYELHKLIACAQLTRNWSPTPELMPTSTQNLFRNGMKKFKHIWYF
jgi:hypothetical protein